MLESISLTFSNVIRFRMIFSISYHVLTHHLKMEWPKGKIDILRLLRHFSFKCKFINLFGLMPFLQLTFSLNAYFQ